MDRPRIEVQDAEGRWVDIASLSGEPLVESAPLTPIPFAPVVPIAAGWLRRCPTHTTITIGVLPGAERRAPMLSRAGWFAWAVDAASVYLAERGAR